MKYDFDCFHSRTGTGSAKWDAVKSIFGNDDIIPMWVADMDLPAAEPVVDALKERALHPFYGYVDAGNEITETIIDRTQRVFNWHVEPDWIVLTPGVMPALNVAIRSLSRPGDEIILQEPVYYPFFPSVKDSGCQVVTNTLRLNNGRYEMDYEDLERCFGPRLELTETPGRVKAMVICNPHNPVGRVWSREELLKAGETALKHGAVVLSDEIHCELLYKGYSHTPFAALSGEFARNSIVFMAPSKTFNLAGLGISTVIIPDRQIREAFNTVRKGIVPGPNIFALTALQAAYRYGDEWLSQLLDYLQDNLDFTLDFFRERIPHITAIEPQGTYLLWLDCRRLGLDDMELRRFMREQARIGLDDGFMFGAGGSGFQRMNIACPRSLLNEALVRLEKAVKGLSIS